MANHDEIQNLRDEAKGHFAEMRSILTENPEGLTAEDSQAYDRLESDHDAKMRAADAAERAVGAAAEVSGAEARSLALPGAEAQAIEGEVRGEMVRANGTDEYRHAFEKFVRGDMDGETRAALVKGTAANGGYLVPETWGNELIRSLVSVSPMLGKARSYQTASGEKFHVPVVTFDAATAPLNQPNLKAAAIAEGGAYVETEDTFTEAVFQAFKFGTIAKVSDELIRDSYQNIDQIIREQATATLGYTIGSSVATGSGSSAPQGYSKAATGVTTAGAAAITASELISAQHAIGVPYRSGAEWFVSDSALQAIRKLTDSNGRFLMQWDFSQDATPTLLGKPVNVDPFLPALTATNNAIVYGNANLGFGVRRVAGINLRVLTEAYAANGYIGYRLDCSLDSRLLDPAALVSITQHA